MATGPSTQAGSIDRVDPALDAIVPAEAKIEKLAGGFAFTEGPIWFKQERYLLFSDIPGNAIHKWTPDGKVALFRKPSGYDKNDAPPGAFIGSNGMTLDQQTRLIICEHGNHRVTRLEKDGSLTVLADQWEGKRLNSPNDIVQKSNGDLYFTDPPYGLVKQDQDPKKELDFNGVFRISNGKLHLLYKGVARPNGLAFTPDEKHMYLNNSEPHNKICLRFDVRDDGSLEGLERRRSRWYEDRPKRKCLLYRAGRSLDLFERRTASGDDQAAGSAGQPALGRWRFEDSLHYGTDWVIPDKAESGRDPAVGVRTRLPAASFCSYGA